MPRTKIGRNPAANIGANIAYYANYYNYDIAKLASVLHVSPSTVMNRKRKPEKYTVEELQRLADSFHVSFVDLLARRDSK